MSHYPYRFDHAVFPAIAPMVPPRPGPMALLARVAPELSGALKPAKLIYATATTVWIQPKGNQWEHSEPFDNLTSSATSKMPDMNAHYHFLPGIDEVEIDWVVEYPRRVGKLEVQLYSAHFAAPVFTKTYQDGAAQTAAAKTGPSLAWSEIAIADPRFPGGRPDVAHAPYQLRLVVTDADTGCESMAWTYFDVLVHSIELHWGPAAWIPNAPIPDTSPLFGPMAQARETVVLQRLKKQAKTTDPAVTGIDGTDIMIDLPSACAGYVHWAEWQCFWKDLAFLRYRGLWGLGPRVPLLAKVYPKRADGTKLDPDAGHATWADVGKVVGPAAILWDWHDRPEAGRRLQERQRWTAAGDFVMRALAYKPNDGDEPPDCRNCHVDRGGRRAGPDRVLPTAAANPLPSAVVAATTRKWASLSNVAATGSMAGHAGILFHPSRMAGDTYKLRAMLANELVADKSKLVLDVATPVDDLLDDSHGLPMGETGMLEMRRLIPARYVRKAGYYDEIDLTKIDERFAPAGVKIEWTRELWTEAEYNLHLTAALAGAVHQESAAEVRGHRSQDAAVKRRSVIAPLVGRGTLARFDHWFGWKVGRLKPTPSEVCLTHPDRATAINPFIAAAHLAWVAAVKETKSRTKKWTEFRAKSPHDPEDDVRIRQVLTKLRKSDRRWVMTEAKRLYTAAGWSLFEEADEEKWAVAHFAYTQGWIDVVMEQHQRKIMADAFEGVTFFHYINLWETVDSGGASVARDYSLGGVAKVDTSADLGLKSMFFVWDHPDDRRRGGNRGPDTMDGNETAAHEFGHNLHLSHSFGERFNLQMHDQNPPMNGDAHPCLMNYDADTELCGVCRLRVRGWSFAKAGAFKGFGNRDPATDGAAPHPGAAALSGFYVDFIV